MRLLAQDVTWTAQARRIVDRVTFEVVPGQLVGLLGPNGSGKSSLLRCVAGLRPLDSGLVLYDGEDLAGLSRRAAARAVAVVDQEAATEVDLRLRDVVGLGRAPHHDRWGGASAADAAAVGAAMSAVGIHDLADRRWSTLSGGERQRAHIARALAQEPRCLLLDEPTNHLDIRHQLELFELLASAAVTAVAALHDLPLAARSCDWLVLLRDGRVVVEGPPAQALDSDVIADVYGVRAVVTPVGTRGRAAVAYTGLAGA